jgi:ATP-binding cassette subfamily C protein
MRFLIKMARAYQGRTIIVLIAMLLAGLAEGFGLSAMLPLLSIAIGSQASVGQAVSSSSAAGGSAAERAVKEAFGYLGVDPTLELLVLFILLAIILKSILVLLANKQIGYTVAQIATDLRLEFLRALIVSRWEFHLRQPVGRLANAMATESNRASKAYHSGTNMTIAAIQALIYVGVACLVSWKATLVALSAGLIIFYALKYFVTKARRAGERQTRVLKSLGGHLIDSLQSIKPLKAMALENLAESVLSTDTNKLNKALRKQVISREYLHAFQEPLRFIFLLLALYGALIYLQLPMATIFVLLFLIARVLIQIGKVQEQYQKMVMLESGYWSLHSKIKEAEKERESGLGAKIPLFRNTIRLAKVDFAYGNKFVLQDVSLTFPVGMITAIVGPSGSGKTTIIDLVIGLLRPKQGEILIDDLPLSQIDLHSWRQMIGYVPQEILLLHDTVHQNITLGDPKLNEKDAERALRAAGAWEFVLRLPQGIKSTVGERGGKISGGQRQRIAIARALVRKPKLLILDEATTALDPENEKAICSSLAQLRGELTILAISHQPAVLDVADRAFRIQNGKAVPVTEIQAPTGLKSEEIHTHFS